MMTLSWFTLIHDDRLAVENGTGMSGTKLALKRKDTGSQKQQSREAETQKNDEHNDATLSQVQ